MLVLSVSTVPGKTGRDGAFNRTAALISTRLGGDHTYLPLLTITSHSVLGKVRMLVMSKLHRLLSEGAITNFFTHSLHDILVE